MNMSCFFGVAGSRNDVNVFYESPLFNKILEGDALEAYFTINGSPYT